MERSKIEAFFREFPFLTDYISLDLVGDVRVSRLDEKFLKETPVRDATYLTYPDNYQSEIILLLDCDGKQVAEVQAHGNYFLKKRQWWHPKRWFGDIVDGESVGDALIRIKDEANKVVYALYLEHHGREHLWKLTLHKPPKTFTLLGWVEELIRREQVVIQGDVLDIDMEAN